MKRASAWIVCLGFAIALCLEARAGWIFLHGDLVDSDPPAHFATGVMLHDYLLSHHRAQPISFARCFYLHYPKVALGHWPPLFYVFEALWFFAFGPTTRAAIWLGGAITAVYALALYRRVAARVGPWFAVAAAAVLLALPVVQAQAWTVMSDVLLGVFVFLSLGSLSDYLTAGQRRDALMFAVWVSAAILTKATGWLLLAPVLLAPLLTGRRREYGKLTYWSAVAAILVISAPFYIWAGLAHLAYPLELKRRSLLLLADASHLSVARGAAIALCLVAAAWAIRYAWRREALSRGSTEICVMAAWILTQAGLLAVTSATRELDRFYVPSIAPALFILTLAMAVAQRRLAHRGFRYTALAPVAIYACVIIACVLIRPPLASTRAYSDALGSIPRLRDETILVESDPDGEGAFVAASLEHDPSRSSYILRSTKLLSSSDWNRWSYSLTYRTEAEVSDALSALGVDYVIEDTSAPVRPDVPLLEAALRDPAARWEVVGERRVAMGPRRGELITYRRGTVVRRSAPLAVKLGPEEASQQLTCATDALN